MTIESGVGRKIFAGQNGGHTRRVGVQLNHIIVSCRDQRRSAAFLTGILGLPTATRFALFLVVEAGNGVWLDFAETTATIPPPALRLPRWRGGLRRRLWPHPGPGPAVPGRSQPEPTGAINHRNAGRGLYF